MPHDLGRKIVDKAGAGKIDQSTVHAWQFFDPRQLQGQPIPEREWLVQDWLSPGHVTGLYADGGTGKTLVAQQLLTSSATGRPWLGMETKQCKTIGLFCEDDQDELHRRQHRINEAYGIDFDQLENMRWVSGVGRDNTLAALTPDGALCATPALLDFTVQAEQHKARLLVIDTSADTFGGDENVRRQVRQFVGTILGGLALRLNAAVILNCHPSRSGMNSGSLDGGSTGWNNTFRSRWTMERPKGDGDVGTDCSERILTRRKSNYSSIGDTIRLRWQNGVLVPIAAPGRLEAMAAAQGAETVFLALLARTVTEGRHVSDARTATNYAPKQFAQRPDREGFNKRDFEAAMQRLFATGRIMMAEYGRTTGRGSRPRHMVRTEAAVDA